MDSRQNKLTKPMVTAALALACCCLWGSAFPCIKIGYRLFSIDSGDTASIILFAGVRFFSAGLLAVLAGSMIQRRALLPHLRDWKPISAVSLCQTFAQYSLFYLGLAYTTAVRSSIVNGSIVFISVLISCLIFRLEKLTGRKILSCVLGFSGILVMNISALSEGVEPRYLIGDGFILLSGVATSLSYSLVKKFSQTLDPTLLSGWQFAEGGAALILVGVTMGGKLRFDSAGCFWILAWLAFVSAMAYTLWSILLKYNPVSKVSVFMFSTPIFGVLLSALLLGEKGQAFRVESLAALVLVCLSTLLIHTEGRKAQA